MLQQQNPNQALPEIIRVRAQKGFRAHVDGQFGVVNPGDVVEVPRVLAMELRGAQKAVMTDAEKVRQKDYLPARKKNPPKDVSSQLQVLTETVQGLAAAVAVLAKKKGE